MESSSNGRPMGEWLVEKPGRSNIWVNQRADPRLDASGDFGDLLLLAGNVADYERVEDLVSLNLVNLSSMTMEIARLYGGTIEPSTGYDLALPEDIPFVLANESLLEGLVAHLICRAIDSTRGSWSTLSLSTGVLGDHEGPLYRGDLRCALPHDQYAYLEVHDTGNSSATGQHRVIEEPFSSSRYPGDAMGIATARRLLQSQGGEIFVQSNRWDGNSVVLALPYCSAHGLEGR